MNNNLSKIDKNMNNARLTATNVKWYDCLELHFSNQAVIHGLAFLEQNKNYHRLIDSININNSLTTLSAHPSGGYASFVTDSSSLSVKVLTASAAYMSHMSACGQCGLDLYYFDEELNKFIFLGTTKINEPYYSLTIVKDMPKKKRLYRLYFPLYVQLLSLSIGIDDDAFINRGEEVTDEKIVFYGTSITQGGCATRPGMSYSSILGRSSLLDVYNLGFSGSAMLEREVAEAISKISKVKYLFIEAEANAGECEKMVQNLHEFLSIVTKSCEQIYLITRYPCPLTLVHESTKNRILANDKFQHDTCNDFSNVQYINGYELLSNLDFEETVDTVHLTDLGFYHLAKYFKKILEKNDSYLFNSWNPIKKI